MVSSLSHLQRNGVSQGDRTLGMTLCPDCSPQASITAAGSHECLSAISFKLASVWSSEPAEPSLSWPPSYVSAKCVQEKKSKKNHGGCKRGRKPPLYGK